MTQEIQWGPAIAVDGKRPASISLPARRWQYNCADYIGWATGKYDGAHGYMWGDISHIRLPADHPHYRQTEEAPIDWSGELEAVHEDGRVTPVTLREGHGPDVDGDYVINGNIDGFNTFNAAGLHYAGLTGTHIRNVPQPTPQADTKPDLTARMEALVRKMALADKQEFLAMGTGCREAYAEAGVIVALLPEPVDPDLIEAREIACDTLTSWDDAMKANCRRGDYDSNLFVVAARKALARGRALALTGQKEA